MKEIITNIAKEKTFEFLKKNYKKDFIERYYEGLDNKKYGDYCYISDDIKINVDFKYSDKQSQNGKISLELTDYKNETWLTNNNINYLVFETPKEIIILSHNKMKRLAATFLTADYGNGKDFFQTSTNLYKNPHFKDWSIKHFENIKPLTISRAKYKKIKNYVECHSITNQGLLVSLKIEFLEILGLIEFYYLK